MVGNSSDGLSTHCIGYQDKASGFIDGLSTPSNSAGLEVTNAPGSNVASRMEVLRARIGAKEEVRRKCGEETAVAAPLPKRRRLWRKTRVVDVIPHVSIDPVCDAKRRRLTV